MTSASKKAALHDGPCQHITAASDKLQDQLFALLRIFKVAAYKHGEMALGSAHAHD